MPAAFGSVCVGSGGGEWEQNMPRLSVKIIKYPQVSVRSSSFIFESGFHPLLLAAYRPDSLPQEFLGTLHLSKTGGIIIVLKFLWLLEIQFRFSSTQAQSPHHRDLTIAMV